MTHLVTDNYFPQSTPLPHMNSTKKQKLMFDKRVLTYEFWKNKYATIGQEARMEEEMAQDCL